MLIVYIKSRKIIDFEAMDLGDVVLVAAHCARWWSARRYDVLNEAEYVRSSSVKQMIFLRAYFSKKFSNSSATFSPTLSTTLEIAAARGSRGRFPVPRKPTISSSAKPSTSLSPPLISDGGCGEERFALCLRGPGRRFLFPRGVRSGPGISEFIVRFTLDIMR